MNCPVCEKKGVETELAAQQRVCPVCEVTVIWPMADYLPAGSSLVGEFDILGFLGRGGFGITYLAWEKNLERLVTIKEFYPREHAYRDTDTRRLEAITGHASVLERGLTRFRNEGITLVRFRHDNIVQAYRLIEANGTAYLVMEYVEGQSLSARLENRQKQGFTGLPESEVCRIGRALVGALEMVHASGISHLDIKPDNVMLTPEGRVVLIDFGASRQGLGSKSTQAFSPAYAPPELLAGNYQAQSDIFLLGMTIYELFTGEIPPDATMRLLGERAGQRWQATALQEPWRTLVNSATELEMSQRPATVREWWQPVCEAPGQDFPLTVTLKASQARNGCPYTYGDNAIGQGKITIPPGVRHNQVLTFPELGYEAPCGGKRGALAVSIKIDKQTDTPPTPPGPPKPLPSKNKNAKVAPLLAGVGLIAVAFVLWGRFSNLSGGKPETDANTPTVTQTPAIVMVTKRICTISGALAGAYCPKAAEKQFQSGKEPRELCKTHSEVAKKQADTALRAAVKKRDSITARTAVRAALDAGADLEMMLDDSGRTPLIHAVENQKWALAKLLIERGANVKARTKNKDGDSALDFAAYRGNAAIAEALINKGALPDEPNGQKMRPLATAAMWNRLEVIHVLLKHGAKKELKSGKEELTPLQWATKYKSYAAIFAL